MVYWDEPASSDVGYVVKYYCVVCQDFFDLSPIAPLRCPWCYADPRYIVGPVPVREYDIDKLVRKQERKYGPKMRR